FSIPVATAVLHLLCWLRLRGVRPDGATLGPAARAGVQVVAITLGILLILFVGLCALEAFGEPPLMASARRPISDFSGTWTGTLTTVSRHRLDTPIAVEF